MDPVSLAVQHKRPGPEAAPGLGMGRKKKSAPLHNLQARVFVLGAALGQPVLRTSARDFGMH